MKIIGAIILFLGIANAAKVQLAIGVINEFTEEVRESVEIALPLIAFAEFGLLIVFHWQVRRDLRRFKRCLALMGIGAGIWFFGVLIFAVCVRNIGIGLFSTGHLIRALGELRLAFRHVRRAWGNRSLPR